MEAARLRVAPGAVYLFPAAGAGVAASGRAGDAEFLRGVRRPRVERKAQPPRACPRLPARSDFFIDLAQKIGAQFIAGRMKWGFVSPSCKPYIMR
ncbi:hypothetical protein A8H37_08740 [Burkholderia thailandensis]|nr:hypothetical protein A8H37_08740 [Burkholderia thailandensis]